MRASRPAAVIVSITLAAAMLSCGGGADSAPSVTPTSPPGTIELRYDGGVLHVELAVTPEERSTGLMFRESLAPDAGMLFVYEPPRIPSFWMKNTLIPLDMIWIGEDKRIVEVDAGVQPEPGVADAQLRRYSPDVAVSYTLELNAGAAARLGLAPGSQLAFDLPSIP